MPLKESTDQVVLEELERVLSSEGFARNDRLRRFLRVAVEWKLAGRAEELKESVLGVEVFGRSPGYDPKRDPVVRTEASRLRARLNEYYAGAGADSRLVIDLPKGGYAPEWRQRDVMEPVTPVLAAPRWGWSRASVVLVLGILTATLAIAGWRWVGGNHKPISIAVLPLRNLSDNPATNFFSDGLTGEIIRNLSMIDGLAVRSQASSFAYKNKNTDVQETGRELGADYILAGSIFRDGKQLRVQVQLVKAAENRYVWTDSYDRDSSQVFQIQDEISLGIVNSLRLSLGRGRRKYETSVEAYDLYLKARALQINAVFGDPRSIELFEPHTARGRNGR